MTSTGKRDSTQRSPSGNTEGMRSSSRHCPDNLSMASAPGSIEPVQIRLDDTVGHIFAITHTDAAKMGGQLRRLTHEEVSFGRLRILPIKDVAYWAELAVGGHRIYIVAVLTPESDAQHSSLGVYDLIISGIDTLPAAVHRTLRMSAICLWDRREVKVRFGAMTPGDSPEVPYLQLLLEYTASRAFVDNPNAYTGQHPVLFQITDGEFCEHARNRLHQATITHEDMIRHMKSYAELGRVPGGGPQHRMHPGKGAQVLHHRSLTVYPRDMAATGDGDLSADDESNPPLRVPNRPSADNHIATLERGRMPCTSISVKRGDDLHTPVRIAVTFEILEDRNDRDLDMIEMSIPSSVYENFPAEMHTVQRSNLASRAFWQTPAATVWHRVPDSRAYSFSSPDQQDDRPSSDAGGASAARRPSSEALGARVATDPRLRTIHSGEPIYGVTTHNTERVVVYGSGQDTTPRRAEHVTASPIAPVANGAAAAAGTAPDSPDQQSVDRWRSLGVSPHLSRHIARTQDRVHIPAVQPSAAAELVAPFTPQRLPPDTRDGSEASAMPTLGPVVRGAPAANDW